MTSQNIILTITMLVSDRIDTIEKCMKSLRHLLETVPSELIVVDTAGNQACMDVVRQYTDKIVPFQWCDDFSAARNAGVEKAQGQWLMYLDDDEWFESTGELEHFFLSGDYQNYSSAAYLIRNYLDRSGTQWRDSHVVRLVRREEGTRFIRKVHEQFFPLNSPVCYLKDYAHHYNYAHGSKEERDRHARRNIRLLIEDRRNFPEDTQITAQLIQEYAVAEEYFAAIELCKELWTDEENWKTIVRAQYATYAMGLELRMYLLQKRYADGYEAGRKMLEYLKMRDNVVLAKALVCNLMTELCYQFKKYRETLEYIDRFYVEKKEWDRYPDHYSLDAFSECARYVDDTEASRLKLLRIHIYVILKEWEKAENACNDVNWQDGDLSLQDHTASDIVSLTTHVPYHQAYSLILNVIYGKKDKRPALYSAIDKLEEQGKEILLKYLSRVSPEDAKLCSYHLIYAAKEGDRTTAVSALEKMKQEGYPFFLEDEAYWNSLQRLKINLNAYLTDFNQYRWMEMVQRLCNVVDLKVFEKAYLCLICGLEKTDLRYLSVSALLMEKRLREKEKVSGFGSAEEVWSDLFQLSQYWVSCAAVLYKEDVFMGKMFSAMPPCYQFAWYIMQAGAVKDQDHSLFLRKVADAAKAYPNLKELCKRVIRES